MRPRLLIPLILAAISLLLTFAQWFDFQCDDAFIAFRYAENWVAHGQIVYNLGERVEGYTSFIWVLLLASLHRIGISLPIAAKLLGAASGALLVIFTAQYGQRLFPKRPLGTVVLLAMVVSNVSVAAWTMAGLETPLFAALVVASVVALQEWIDRETLGRAALAAASLTIAMLTRPEAGLLFVSMLLSLAVVTWRTRRLPRGSGVFVLGTLTALSCYLLWRRSYYGDLLPNAFHVKTSGSPEALRARGLAYLGFCAEELGVAFVIGLLVLVLLPLFGAANTQRGQQAARHTVQAFVLSMLAYISSIGGDFLDLYRFMVPLFPLVFGAAICALLGLSYKWRIPPRFAWTLPTVGISFLAWYGSHQILLARRATQLSESGRSAHEIEPLGWTATYTRRWAAMGRWIADHAAPGDTLAVGAAGAMPFFARLTNIDTFGLCDRYVARHGTIIGSRPGHQRFAPIDYLLRRAPTFLLINDYARDYPAKFRPDPAWEQRGYIWVEAQLSPNVHQAPSAFFHYLLVRKDRAAELSARPMTRVADR